MRRDLPYLGLVCRAAGCRLDALPSGDGFCEPHHRRNQIHGTPHGGTGEVRQPTTEAQIHYLRTATARMIRDRRNRNIPRQGRTTP